MSDDGTGSLRLVLLARNLHVLVGTWLLGYATVQEAVLDFLFLLDEIAASAEATSQAVDWEITLKTEAVHGITALQEGRHDCCRAASTRPISNTGSIDWAPVTELGVVVKTVMSLAEGHARAEAGDDAEINGGEELDEAVVPWLVGGRHWGSDCLWFLQGSSDTLSPVGHVVIASRSRSSSNLLLRGNLLLLGVIVGGHCDDS